MDQHERDMQYLIRYIRKHGYRIGHGLIAKKLMEIISEGDDDAALRHLDNIMRSPRDAALLLDLVGRDIFKKAPKPKVRRGIGSY